MTYKSLLHLGLLFCPLFISANLQANQIIHGGTIYTLNADQPQAKAIVVDGQRIQFVGGYIAAKTFANDKTNYLDLKGRTLTPGFIESHGHIMGLGYSKLILDLSDAANYEALIQQVAQAVKRAQPGEWIQGRGWHQSKWSPQPQELVRGFQTHERLSEISPNNPVFLRHASGHAAMANALAMEIAGVNAESEVSGDGEIIKDKQLRPTGIFNENAQSLIQQYIPRFSRSQQEQALDLALNEMARNGITSIHDAGVGRQDIALFRDYLSQGKLSARLYLMLAGGEKELLLDWFRRGPEIGDYLTIRGIKLMADGALGSRGAWLIEPYTDAPGHLGLPGMPLAYIQKISQQAFDKNFQIAVHAIGDRANREVLNLFETLFDGQNQGVRFRIEHAQHINSADIPRFADLGIIAAVQGIHMSSDRPWAIDRLGMKRIEDGAYVWRKLLDAGVKVINGTDVPVEPINPIASFYALVTRQTLAGKPDGGFEPSQKMTRMEALRSYTLDAAYGAFEERQKGSIEVGKLADFTVFDQDILQIADRKLLSTRVVRTIVGGETVYQRGTN